jgi:hypothetical protein
MKAITLNAPLIGILAALTAAGAAGTASAQNAPIEYRLTADKANPAGCTSLDASLSRVHTVTVTGDKALLKSAGGINDTLKQASPGIYKTTFSLAGVRLDVVADASTPPRSLTVVEAQRSCKWNAVAP